MAVGEIVGGGGFVEGEKEIEACCEADWASAEAESVDVFETVPLTAPPIIAASRTTEMMLTGMKRVRRLRL